MTTKALAVTDPFDSPTEPIDRDRYGRPLVVPPGGGKAVGYTRATTYAGAIEDTYNLQQWMVRTTAIGLSLRPDLMLGVTAARSEAETKHGKRDLDRLCDDARAAAKGSAKATIGTAVHKLTEIYDRGEDVGVIPEDARRDLDAYIEATRDVNFVSREQFRVYDDLKIGGTADGVIDFGDEFIISDTKTGSIEFGIGKIAMQLAIYAHSTPYDHATRKRIPDAKPVNKKKALIIHLPAGQGVCTPVWVDIEAGWEAVQLATQVRAWRNRKNLTEPAILQSSDQILEDWLAESAAPSVSLLDQAAAFTDLAELRRWYLEAERDGRGSAELLAACTARASQLKVAG